MNSKMTRELVHRDVDNAVEKTRKCLDSWGVAEYATVKRLVGMDLRNSVHFFVGVKRLDD